MNQLIRSIPVVGPIVLRIYRKSINTLKPFPGSNNYWMHRYEAGQNSGDGSYNQLAEFKAEIINEFVQENDIKSVIEYGCGDGNQLGLARYPSYIGFDISPKAISKCKERFPKGDTKTFKLMKEYDRETAELTLSLDVIYHLVEDGVFADYMNRLFDSSNSFVIIYSSNTDENPEEQPAHIKNRAFSKWIKENKPNWKLSRHIRNKYPFTGDTRTGSFADFFIYKKD